MADTLKPPPLNNDINKEEDDDTEDLFVSALETNSKQTENSNDSTLKSNSPDMMSGSVGDEIDLQDDSEVQVDDGKAKIGFEDGSKQVGGQEEKVEGDEPAKLEPVENQTTLVHTPSSHITAPQSEALPVKTVTGGGITEIIPKSESNDDHFLEISIGEPSKVGDGMGSYVVYKVSTKTNLPFFRKNDFSVNRRFSDFLGLRDKLAEKHLHVGRIVPPAPDKDAMGTAKIKMSKEDNINQADFIEKRRAALERYVNRTAAHAILRTDPDFREFLELDTDLPKATNTSALSGAGVRRLFNKVGDTMIKMTFRMDESDPWFEEKQNQIENLDSQLRKLYASVEALIHHRKELTLTTGQFAKSAAMLGNCEEHTSLSCALSQLAETEEKIEQLHGDQVTSDYFYLGELLKDYIALMGAVKSVFYERVKVFQTWQNAIQTLNKKREQKARLELQGRPDKVPPANIEITEWEARVTRGQEEFENISKTIKQEVEKFELNRIRDFKTNIVKYMETLLETQQKLIKYWETFLPEAKAIS